VRVVRAPWRGGDAVRDDRATMEADQARSIAEHAHEPDRDGDGPRVLAHLARVVRATPPEAHVVAWLHESLERGAVTEHELLAAGVSSDELRALRLVIAPAWARSERAFLGHIELIARAAGWAGQAARAVKAADLHDGYIHPRAADGWSPPCAQGLRRLRDAGRERHPLTAPTPAMVTVARGGTRLAFDIDASMA